MRCNGNLIVTSWLINGDGGWGDGGFELFRMVKSWKIGTKMYET